MSVERAILHIWRGETVNRAEEPFVCLNDDGSVAEVDLTDFGSDHCGYRGILIHGGQTLSLVAQHFAWDALRASKLPMALSTPKADDKWDPVNLAKLPPGSVIVHPGSSKAEFLDNPERYVREHAPVRNGFRLTYVLLVVLAAVLFQCLMMVVPIPSSIPAGFPKIAVISIVISVVVGACSVYTGLFGKLMAKVKRVRKQKFQGYQRCFTKGLTFKTRSLSVRSNSSDSCFSDYDALIEPPYWHNSGNQDSQGYEKMFYTSDRHSKIIQELLYRTRSPSIANGCATSTGMPETSESAEGCAASTGMPETSECHDGFVVRRVIRIEASRTWTLYKGGFLSVETERDGAVDPIQPLPLTNSIVVAHANDAFSSLATNLNECYLWHGVSSVRIALSIARDGFDQKMGPHGFCFSESSTVADMHTSCEQDGCYADVRALMLCRVCIGKYGSLEACSKGDCDAAVGHTSTGLRKFTVFASNQLYPEYIVLYSHLVNAGDRVVLTPSPLHMELPVYWYNCYKNPKTNLFMEKVHVPPRQQMHLQHFLDNTAPTLQDGCSLRIVSAHRVEHARMWNWYSLCKQRLLQELQASGASAFKAMSEVGVGRNALTHTVLADVKGMNIEDVLSLANMQPELNELLLWHGTSHQAAESIIRNDFNVEEGDLFGATRKVGARFGSGAYFADDIAKSVPYAIQDPSTKLRYFLLCRVVCGDFFYTSDGGKDSWKAATTAEVEGKHSVLAQPPYPREPLPCEFIVWDAGQIYPEYIIAVEWSKDHARE